MHYITAIGFDSDGYIYANDPNKSAHPRKQKQDKFAKCLKQAFIFWPKSKEATSVPFDKAGAVETGATGDAIVDISKWQGNINFSKLAKKVSFVIARAGVGSDPDPLFDQYAEAMQKNGIPFGVYCYSYAGTVEKAKDEAQKLVQRASKYNPLFYVLDAEESKLTNMTIRAFASELKSQGADRIGCYVAHHQYKNYKYDSLRSLFHFTWIPRYGSNDGTVGGATKPAYACDLWQFTSKGKIDGIGGHADLNVIVDSGKTLEWFLNPNYGTGR